MENRNYIKDALLGVATGDAAVTGGLAGLLYGHATIPPEWLEVLARRKDIDSLADRLQEKLSN